jgi:thiol peroxidase
MTTITLKGAELHTSGTLPEVGTKAVDFTVTKIDLGEIHLKNFIGQKIVLNIFPSLDTSTCARAMHRFNDMASMHPEALFLCISADLPFAQKRFCSAEHLSNVLPASVFRHPGFGKEYGVVMTDGPLQGLLSRAVVVINEQGNVAYTEQVDEITEEPNYPAIDTALKA